MAKVANAIASVNLVGDGTTLSTAAGPVANINAAPPSLLTTSAGFTAITIPTGFNIQGVMIVPPAGSIITKTLKGITGDSASIVLSPTGVTMIPITSLAVLGLLCNGIEVIQLNWY